MTELIHRTGCHFRLGESAAGSDALTELLDRLMQTLTSGGSTDECKQAMVPILKRILNAQQCGDFLYIADLLEYELAPLL